MDSYSGELDQDGRTAEEKRFARELIEILNELRVALPGVQVLFAFLLTAPFANRFKELSAVERHVFYAGFLCATLASAFLIAPAIYHRFHWRRDVKDKERMLHTFNQLLITGITFLAAAMICSTFLLSHFMFGPSIGLPITLGAAAVFALLWYVLPLSRRQRERRAPGIPPVAPP